MITVLLLVLLSYGQMHGALNSSWRSGGTKQNHSNEIADLLKQLTPAEAFKEFVINPPDSDTMERVRARLVLIANESPDSRKSVISALIVVLNHPKTAEDFNTVDQWKFAVKLLGELKAVEAIDDLVNLLDRTGEDSPVRRPPVRTALARIGKPAIPQLIAALINSNEVIRREASEALGEIGDPALDDLVNVLSRGGPSTRSGAALALSRIGGTRARTAIENALNVETDDEVKNQLAEAVDYIRHVESLKKIRQ